MASDTEITKVRIVIRHLLWQIRDVRNDRDAAWKWVNRFANTLQYQELEQDPDQYALAILAEARSFNDQQRRKGQMLGVRKQLAKEGVTSPTQEQLDEKWLEMYGQDFTQDAPNGNAGVDISDAGNGAASKSPTSCDQFTADGDIREDSLAKPDGSAITRNETRAHDALGPSANHYGDAHHREAWDVSATDSKNSEARQIRRTGAPSTGATSSTAPVRSPRLPTWDEFVAFIDQQGLDYTDARQWWEMTMVDREGNDRYGKPIGNWKAALKRFCAAKINNRRSA